MRQDLPQNNQDVKYMGSLLSYSGLTTKIRAMQSRLLTDDQYRELAELKSVPQAVTYLKQQPAYEAILDSLSEEALHRGKIEQLLVNSIYRDFTKIYQFSNMEQRKFLNLYFGRYEVSIMKECLNKIFDHRDVNLDLSLFKPFFDKHSQLDINLLTASRSIEEFVSHLRGTSYYQHWPHCPVWKHQRFLTMRWHWIFLIFPPYGRQKTRFSPKRTWKKSPKPTGTNLIC